MSIYYGATSQQSVLSCIKKACEELSPNTASLAIGMLIGTCCAESGLASVRDTYKAEGRGIMQFDSIRVIDIKSYLEGRGSHYNARVINSFGIDIASYSLDELMAMLDVSPLLSCIMCRIGYAMKPEKLPKVGDLAGQARYWKEHWNTHLGAGTPEHYIEQYNNFYGE